MINFEKLPNNDIMQDALKISDQYSTSHGVKFSMVGGLPQVAKVGAPQTAFQCGGNGNGKDCSSDHDGVIPAIKGAVGSFFLTDDGVVNANSFPITVTYGFKVSKLSGVLLDLDGLEKWDIEAFDENGNSLKKIVLEAGPQAGWKDGDVTKWSFDVGTKAIKSVVFTGNGGGFALDRFSPYGICDE